MPSFPFRTIGIFSRPRRANISDVVQPLLDWLVKRGIRGLYDSETAESLRDEAGGQARDVLARECDLILVLGGDGTLIAAGTHLTALGHGRYSGTIEVNVTKVNHHATTGETSHNPSRGPAIIRVTPPTIIP